MRGRRHRTCSINQPTTRGTRTDGQAGSSNQTRVCSLRSIPHLAASCSTKSNPQRPRCQARAVGGRSGGRCRSPRRAPSRCAATPSGSAGRLAFSRAPRRSWTSSLTNSSALSSVAAFTRPSSSCLTADRAAPGAPTPAEISSVWRSEPTRLAVPVVLLRALPNRKLLGSDPRRRSHAGLRGAVIRRVGTPARAP